MAATARRWWGISQARALSPWSHQSQSGSLHFNKAWRGGRASGLKLKTFFSLEVAGTWLRSRLYILCWLREQSLHSPLPPLGRETPACSSHETGIWKHQQLSLQPFFVMFGFCILQAAAISCLQWLQLPLLQIHEESTKNSGLLLHWQETSSLELQKK